MSCFLLHTVFEFVNEAGGEIVILCDVEDGLPFFALSVLSFRNNARATKTLYTSWPLTLPKLHKTDPVGLHLSPWTHNLLAEHQHLLGMYSDCYSYSPNTHHNPHTPQH
jgi:hypothetical protein